MIKYKKSLEEDLEDVKKFILLDEDKITDHKSYFKKTCYWIHRLYQRIYVEGEDTKEPYDVWFLAYIIRGGYKERNQARLFISDISNKTTGKNMYFEESFQMYQWQDDKCFHPRGSNRIPEWQNIVKLQS